MPKVYVIVFYRSPPEASFAEYGELAIPAVHAGGGRILARGLPLKIYEAGMNERVTLIEFDSLEQAMSCVRGGCQAHLSEQAGEGRELSWAGNHRPPGHRLRIEHRSEPPSGAPFRGR